MSGKDGQGMFRSFKHEDDQTGMSSAEILKALEGVGVREGVVIRTETAVESDQQQGDINLYEVSKLSSEGQGKAQLNRLELNKPGNPKVVGQIPYSSIASLYEELDATVCSIYASGVSGVPGKE